MFYILVVLGQVCIPVSPGTKLISCLSGDWYTEKVLWNDSGSFRNEDADQGDQEHSKAASRDPVLPSLKVLLYPNKLLER